MVGRGRTTVTTRGVFHEATGVRNDQLTGEGATSDTLNYFMFH
jgi:hypothetical protein